MPRIFNAQLCHKYYKHVVHRIASKVIGYLTRELNPLERVLHDRSVTL